MQQALKDGKPFKSYVWKVGVIPGEAEKFEEQARYVLKGMDFIIFVISLLLATVTGLLFLYVGKVFGSLSEYLWAFLWGFGIDTAVKGYTAVYTKITQ